MGCAALCAAPLHALVICVFMVIKPKINKLISYFLILTFSLDHQKVNIIFDATILMNDGDYFNVLLYDCPAAVTLSGGLIEALAICALPYSLSTFH